VIVYIDDLILFSHSFEEHLKLIDEVLSIAEENGLTFKLKKCHFFKKQVKYLGHVISPNCVRPDPELSRAIREFERPKTVKALRSFLGLVQFYRSFIFRMSEIASPLYKLLKKNSSFKWEDKHESSFLKLKNSLASSLVLPDFTSPSNWKLMPLLRAWGLSLVKTTR
jgi:hypothetical protein